MQESRICSHQWRLCSAIQPSRQPSRDTTGDVHDCCGASRSFVRGTPPRCPVTSRRFPTIYVEDPAVTFSLIVQSTNTVFQCVYLGKSLYHVVVQNLVSTCMNVSFDYSCPYRSSSEMSYPTCASILWNDHTASRGSQSNPSQTDLIEQKEHIYT